ncbi:hypothetical protein ACFL1G_01735 [Planctomycetota bacterium]
MIAGRRECVQAQKLMYKFLKSQLEKDPENFVSEWVKFDITGSEAAENVWDLLYDYSCYYGHSYLSELRLPYQQITDDWLGNPLQYPMGKIFAFNHYVKTKRWWWKFTCRMNQRIVWVIINTNEVSRLTGDLRQFILYAKVFYIQCNEKIVTLSSTLKA